MKIEKLCGVWVASGKKNGVEFTCTANTRDAARLKGFKVIADLCNIKTEAEKPTRSGLYELRMHNNDIKYRAFTDSGEGLMDTYCNLISNYTGVKSYTELECEA